MIKFTPNESLFWFTFASKLIWRQIWWTWKPNLMDWILWQTEFDGKTLCFWVFLFKLICALWTIILNAINVLVSIPLTLYGNISFHLISMPILIKTIFKRHMISTFIYSKLRERLTLELRWASDTQNYVSVWHSNLRERLTQLSINTEKSIQK